MRSHLCSATAEIFGEPVEAAHAVVASSDYHRPQMGRKRPDQIHTHGERMIIRRQLSLPKFPSVKYVHVFDYNMRSNRPDGNAGQALG